MKKYKIFRIKSIILLSTITLLFSGCAKNDINSINGAYSFLVNEISRKSNLKLNTIKNKFKNFKYEDITSSEIPTVSNNKTTSYSAHIFSNNGGNIKIYFKNDSIIYIDMQNKNDNSNIDMEYITSTEEMISGYKDSNSIRGRYYSDKLNEQEELITLINKKINSEAIYIYEELVEKIQKNTDLSLMDIENILNMKASEPEYREINGVDTNLYTFKYKDSNINIFIDNKNRVQCLIAENLGISNDTPKTDYILEFNPYKLEDIFKTIIYNVNIPKEVQNLNNDIISILK